MSSKVVYPVEVYVNIPFKTFITLDKAESDELPIEQMKEIARKQIIQEIETDTAQMADPCEIEDENIGYIHIDMDGSWEEEE